MSATLLITGCDLVPCVCRSVGCSQQYIHGGMIGFFRLFFFFFHFVNTLILLLFFRLAALRCDAVHIVLFLRKKSKKNYNVTALKLLLEDINCDFMFVNLQKFSKKSLVTVGAGYGLQKGAKK